MGRYSYSNRQILENKVSVTIKEMLNIYHFKNIPQTLNWSSSLSSNGEVFAHVKYFVMIRNRETISPENFIEFTTAISGGKYKQRFSIESQPVHLGGYRYFFKCECGKRVRALWFHNSRWACRHCHGLVYQNCRLNRDVYRLKKFSEKLEKKAEALRQTKHPRLANRALAKSLEYSNLHQAAVDAFLLRRGYVS